MRIKAYDIDGVLTKPEGLNQYRQDQNRANLVLGIVSARSQEDAEQFVADNNLSTDFVRTGALKGRILSDVEDSATFNIEEKTYVGSWFRDRIHAFVAGWQYEEI